MRVGIATFRRQKIPELMKGLGQGVRSFKTAMSEPLPDEQQREQELRNQQAQEQQSQQPTPNESERK